MDSTNILRSERAASAYDLPHEELYWAVKRQVFDPHRALPAPSRDPAVLKADLDCFGYCFVANVLSGDEVAAMKDRVFEQMEMEEKLGRGAPPLPNGNRTCTNLLTKGRIFQAALTNDMVDDLATYVLDDGFLLHSLAVMQSVPGSKAQGLHHDQSRLGFPPPTAFVANVVYMLEDFTEENGATRIVPGSHLWGPEERGRHWRPVTESADHNPEGTIAAVGPAGTCLIYEGRVMHAAGANKTADQTRTGLFAFYCRGWLRTMRNHFLSIPDDVMMSLPVRIREKLGYKPWNAFGTCEAAGGAPPMDIVRPTTFVGELHRT